MFAVTRPRPWCCPLCLLLPLLNILTCVRPDVSQCLKSTIKLVTAHELELYKYVYMCMYMYIHRIVCRMSLTF